MATNSSPAALPPRTVWSVRSMRKRGNRVKIVSGEYGGHTGKVESKVYQKTVGFPVLLADERLDISTDGRGGLPM